MAAAHGGGLVHRRAHYILRGPQVLTGEPALAALPPLFRAFARLVHIDGVLVVEAAKG